MQPDKKHIRGKEVTGTVVKSSMEKTIVVRVGRSTVHKTFKKTIRKFSKFKAHDEKKVAGVGDQVVIKESRPISRQKRWTLVRVVKKS